MRRVCYLSGTRADFGLMKNTLLAISSHPNLDLDVFATGMHLSEQHGLTVTEIEQSGLRLRGRLVTPMAPATGLTMANATAETLRGFAHTLAEDRPDVVLLLGDRGEMLAGAIAALYLNIPVAHIHGGERSGTVDEPVRHAISKLAHWHFTATEDARERLIRMGEAPENVHVTGAPGLDEIHDFTPTSREMVFERYGLDHERPVALLIFHPVLQDADNAGEQVQAVLSALLAADVQILALMPNSDAGSTAVREVLSRVAASADVKVRVHLPRSDLMDAMAHFDLMIGNSSAGIIEAASFGIPVINVGSRQNLRERNSNVVDVGVDRDDLNAAVRKALALRRTVHKNVYGDGNTARAIADFLATKPIRDELMNKANQY